MYNDERRAFGIHGAWLPVQSHDIKTGALTLGHGEFRLAIPVGGDKQWTQSNVLLTATNEVLEPNHVQPKPGEVGLLSCDDQGNPALIGFEEYVVGPIFWKQEQWAKDPLAEYIIERKDGHIFFQRARLAHLIATAGGCIPVTIEQIKIKEDRRWLFISRRSQIAAYSLQRGDQMLCWVLGAIDQSRVLVRYGSELAVLPAQAIISGLPKNHDSAIWQTIREKDIPIWVHVGDDGSIHSGLVQERSAEIHVTGILVLRQHDQAPHNSFNTPSRASAEDILLWRSIDTEAFFAMRPCDASWANLSSEKLETLFQEEWGKGIPARIKTQPGKSSPVLSVVSLTNAKKEFDTLSPGREMTIRFVSRFEQSEPGLNRYVVASKESGVLLECWDKSPQPRAINSELAVEVDQKDIFQGGTVIVVPIGQREYSLDLPERLLRSIQVGIEKSDTFGRYLELRRRTAAGDFSNVSSADDAEEAAICAAYANMSDSSQLRKHLPSVIHWSEKQLIRPAFELPYALMAIIVLFESRTLLKHAPKEGQELVPSEEVRYCLEHWNTLSVRLAHLVADHALRSLHVETLGRHWLDNQDARTRKHPPIWSRLNQLISRIQFPLSPKVIQSISGFVFAAEQSGIKEIAPIASGLKLAMGVAVNPSDFNGPSPLLAELISIRNTLPQMRNGVTPELLRSHVKRLANVLDSIDAQGIDLQLLDTLPWKDT